MKGVITHFSDQFINQTKNCRAIGEEKFVTSLRSSFSIALLSKVYRFQYGNTLRFTMWVVLKRSVGDMHSNGSSEWTCEAHEADFVVLFSPS